MSEAKPITKKQPCLKCGGVLYETAARDEKGTPALLVGDTPKMEFDGTDYYLVCLHCEAKNVVVLTASTHGELPRLRVSHVKGG